MKVDTTYSCASFNGDLLRVKAKLADYNGNKELWKEKVADTSNMLMHFGDVGGKLILNIMKMSDMVDAQVNVEHGDGNMTSHTQQNN